MGDSGGGGRGAGAAGSAPGAVRRNDLGQPIGPAVADWTGARAPSRTSIEGVSCRLEPLEVMRHAQALYDACAEDREGRLFTYLPYGPFESVENYAAWMRGMCADPDLQPFAIVEAGDGRPVGVASYLRAAPAAGSIEVGHLCYAPALQRTRAATEAMFRMMARAFEEWGYRRYEWKCDALNGPSRAAATRLGFRYEGTFRSHLVTKGRNRDTAWYSIVAGEWPALRRAFEAWLAPGNFDGSGRQRQTLATWMPDSAGAPLVIDV